MDRSTSFETEHVHQVYEHIASDFSRTRHSPWPFVQNFLEKLPHGSIVLDAGCGNGKYLGIDSILSTSVRPTPLHTALQHKLKIKSSSPSSSSKQNTTLKLNNELVIEHPRKEGKKMLNIGLDISSGLLAIASKEKGHEVVKADCIDLKCWRSGVFDHAISIATIHHFATRQRRIESIKQLIELVLPPEPFNSSFSIPESTTTSSSPTPERVFRKTNRERTLGTILILVWAFEQDPKLSGIGSARKIVSRDQDQREAEVHEVAFKDRDGIDDLRDRDGENEGSGKKQEGGNETSRISNQFDEASKSSGKQLKKKLFKGGARPVEELLSSTSSSSSSSSISYETKSNLNLDRDSNGNAEDRLTEVPTGREQGREVDEEEKVGREDERDVFVPWQIQQNHARSGADEKKQARKAGSRRRKGKGVLEQTLNGEGQALDVEEEEKDDQEKEGELKEKTPEPKTFQRYYHLFKTGELTSLVEQAARQLGATFERDRKGSSREDGGEGVWEKVVRLEEEVWERENWTAEIEVFWRRTS